MRCCMQDLTAVGVQPMLCLLTLYVDVHDLGPSQKSMSCPVMVHVDVFLKCLCCCCCNWFDSFLNSVLMRSELDYWFPY
ncbi:unnamed protein product [Toxocara canis]|uniref:Secreted protein n=1 Tax=Toxocara canis TaxID=6265 RepID=A0A183VEF2_TOXCA|nr:unnamed protein product [Toxocara canis]